MNTLTHTELIQNTPLIKPGAQIVADSCSVIFLNRLSLLEAYADIHKILLTQMVYDEITSIPRDAHAAEDTSLYVKLCSSGTISVHSAEAHPAPTRATLSVADLTLITAFNMLKPAGILTDDKALCSYCRKNAIPYINTPIVLFIMKWG